ncbi:coenzyme A diphosphatase NUDT7 [Bacillus sp. SORGH_AS 510]|uniref:NUDIX hydrolase n=1 Tax=Bacillus sp. SORGH_AS_0510 TaxID=3041771 RepID=UPI0027817001|nr:CoA pyrophosphatase [Bacillus sp. SORGH_AS_0510]MDQ1145516.1 coenzyme A diphosphatase NUDT7 [Bacillus sp. SORGH_AS_0510]
MNLENILRKLTNHTPTILGSEKFSKFAIMLPLLQKENEIHVLFEVRSLELRRQPGEICFPGGKIDSQDINEQGAAIRETVEELGISREAIKNIFPLDYMISPYGMIVYPFVGFITEPNKVKPNPSEVGEIFTVPLSFFVNHPPNIYKINFKAEPEENFPYDLIAGGKNYNWRTRDLEEYFYHYNDKVIWGLTAKILVHFIEMVR